MSPRLHSLKVGRSEVVLDTAVGHLRRLALDTGDRVITPLHTAPWVSDAPIDPDSVTPPTEQALSGDFFCAPFCASDVEASPLHGWTANAPWSLESEGDGVATFALSRPVMGARVRKTLCLVEGHPFLYLAHAFEGGAGSIPVSHHAMIRSEGTTRLSFSPKSLFFTPATAIEPDPARGRSLLQYPALGTDLSAVPLAAGGTLDLRTYPVTELHEDVVALSEASLDGLAWTAAVREADDDIVLLLKNSRALPQTMLWMSNGGRDYAPWNGRHTRVLGIEDGCSFGPFGHRASIEPNMLTRRAVPTAIDLSVSPRIDYAIGVVPRPAGWMEIGSIASGMDGLTLTEVGGQTLTVPFDAHWLSGR